MSIIELVDIKTTPDIVHEYHPSLKADQTPLVIDNGSYQCRVGWSSCDSPLLVFRNLIAKQRKDRKKDSNAEALPIQIGNDIVNIEAIRMQLKTQFDRNVVTHFHNQEQILDYIFEHLNIDGDGCVPHPIVMTEPLGNPNYCRQQLNELLFECYGIPGLSYGIDSIFSWQHNKKFLQDQNDALIISFGYHTTEVVPILNGRLQAEHVRRISLGGYHIITYLFRLMQMKYPVHLAAITIGRMETLLHQHGSIAIDYQAALRQWASVEYYTEHIKKIQLPYTAPVQNTSTLTPEQKLEKRRELARRLIESNMRRCRKQLEEDEEQIEIMQNIRQLHEDGDEQKFQAALKENKISNLQALDKMMNAVRCRIDRNKQKLSGPTEIVIKEKEVPAFAKPPADVPLEQWLSEIKGKREEILKRKDTRKTRRREIAKRHTVAAQERMRIISLLARNEKGSDEFGANDNDWDVYKIIRRDNDSDSEYENEQMMEYDNILRYHDASLDEQSGPGPAGATFSAEHYQLHVGVEAIRAPELLFQPSMIGSCEAGLAELIDFVFKLFSPAEQLRLASNVFMTGGCSQFPGLKERLSRELLEMRPFQTPHRLSMAEAPQMNAWQGALDFSRSSDLKSCLTTKQDYEEKGSEYLKSHHASNFYFPTVKQ